MQLTFPKCDILCFHDLPSQEVLDALKVWLAESEERKVVIFAEGTRELHPQIQWCAKDDGAIEKLAAEKVFLHFDYLPAKDGDDLFFSKVEAIVQRKALNASDFQNRGIDRLHNLLKNSILFPAAYEAKDLFGSFSQIPAIICGAGPSLEREIPYLRLLNERALLFAGGAALSSLSSFEIKPHFGGLIDPHPPTEIDFASSAMEGPCFFQSRVHPDKLLSLQGPLLWTAGSDHDFFEEASFEGGWNVSTYLTALACHLGCNPIVLVGVDLCGREGKIYSGGLERRDEMIEISDGVATKKDWLFAARFLTEFAKKHPEVDWINASDGIEFGGYEKKRLHEIPFESEYDLNGKIHASIIGRQRGVMKGFDREKIRESLDRMSSLCKQILGRLEKSFPHLPSQDGEYTLLTVELEREETYALFAKKVWEVWKPVFVRSIPKEMPQEFGVELNRLLFIQGICHEAKQI